MGAEFLKLERLRSHLARKARQNFNQGYPKYNELYHFTKWLLKLKDYFKLIADSYGEKRIRYQLLAVP
ncbi:MAG: hypothetical protein LDL41_16145 [Coleofasciculus sp. S288]|nr:hypothetical protein [Coleofasciculus sp. S288]